MCQRVYFFSGIKMRYRRIITAVCLKYRPVGIAQGQGGKTVFFHFPETYNAGFVAHQGEAGRDQFALEYERLRRIQVAAQVLDFHPLRTA